MPCVRSMSFGLAISAVTTVACAQWGVTSLHPAGATYSRANGVSGAQVVGEVATATTHGAATIWTGGAESALSIHPPQQPFGPSRARATNGTHQFGSVNTLAQTPTGNLISVDIAVMWNGASGSVVYLRPNSPVSFSSVAGVGGTKAIGYYQPFDEQFGGVQRAALWDTSTGSMTLLSPDPSAGNDTDGTTHVGRLTTQQTTRAVMWTGPAFTQTLLHPAWALNSTAAGVSNGRQSGTVGVSAGINHAGYWTGSADSWVDLHPSNASSSAATDIAGNYMVGESTIDGQRRAGVWHLPTGAFTDLHSLLPDGFARSLANGVSVSGDMVRVAGTATTTAGSDRAFVWTATIPAPSPVAALTLLLGVCCRRRRSPQAT